MALNLNKVLQPIKNSISVQQIRFRSKINIGKPKPFHHERGKVMQFLTPFYPNPLKGKPLWEVCENINKKAAKTIEANPYETIIAREVLNWFNSSKMIAFFHKNSMNADDDFDFRVNLKRKNMYGKLYGKKVVQLALTNTVYAPVLELFCSPVVLVFSPDVNVTALHKVARKTTQLTLMAGILDGKLLSRKEFLEYGKMDLTSARAGLVSLLQNAGGNNLNKQLTYHQSSLITRLQQIGTTEN